MAKMNALKKVQAGESIATGGPAEAEKDTIIAELRANQKAERVDPNTLRTIEPFSGLWTRKPEIVAALVESMKRNGFDDAQPVIVWESPTSGRVVLDGHTRKEAAILAGVDAYVVGKTFGSTEEAYEYALGLQFDRRNLRDDDLLHFAIRHLTEEIPGSGKKSARLARFFKISETFAKHVFVVAREASDEERAAIFDPKTQASIHSVYAAIMARRTAKDEVATTEGANLPPPSVFIETAPASPPATAQLPRTENEETRERTPRSTPRTASQPPEATSPVGQGESPMTLRVRTWAATATPEEEAGGKAMVLILMEMGAIPSTVKDVVLDAMAEGANY